MEIEKIIAKTVDRIQKSGKDAVNNMEESKNGDGDRVKVKRGQMVDWCELVVHILMEPLEDHEKIRALSGVQESIRNRGRAPQEILAELSLQE